MVKRMVLVRRRPDLSVAEFADYWVNVHAKIGQRLRGIRGYRINIVTKWLNLTDSQSAWDGIAELWFDSEEEMDAALAEYRLELTADSENFLSEIQVAIVREHRAV